MSYISAEWQKLRKIQLLVIALIFLGFASFIGLFNYSYYHDQLLAGTQGRVLWGQLTFYYSYLLYPALITIWVGLALVAEFDRGNIAFLRANNVSVTRLLVGKFVSLLLLLCPLQAIIVLLYTLVAAFNGELGQIPWLHILKWYVVSIILTLPLIVIQAYLVSVTRNLIQSVSLGALAGLGNFVVLFMGNSAKIVYPYLYPGLALRSREMANLDRLDYKLSELSQWLVLGAIYTIVFFWLTKRRLEAKDK